MLERVTVISVGLRSATSSPPHDLLLGTAHGFDLGESSPLEGGDVELTRRVDAWALLQRAAAEGLPALIVTPIAEYDDVYLEEAATEFTAADGTWMRVELTFLPIRKVSTELVEDVAPDRDRRTRNAGAVSMQEPSASETELYNLTGGDPSRLPEVMRDPLGAIFGS